MKGRNCQAVRGNQQGDAIVIVLVCQWPSPPPALPCELTCFLLLLRR